VFAAKAVAIGSVMSLAGLIATTGSYLIARPMLAGRGFTAPAYPELGLFEGPVLRAVVGSALMLGLVAVLSLAVATLVRRGAAAIALLLALFVLPVIVLQGLPLEVGLWINRATPIAGLAIMQTRHRFDTAIEPWAGLGVLAAYAVVALLLAMWRIRRRDA
jgi:ABC-type transport system involved in multi-copper enzyme maturation permease subunit